jgi:hypothetical protein
VAYIDYCHGISFSHYDVLDDHPDCLNMPFSATSTTTAAEPSPFSPCIPRQHRFSLTFRHKI